MRLEGTQLSVQKEKKGGGDVDTSYIELTEGTLGGNNEGGSEAGELFNAEAFADEMFGPSEKPPQTPEVIAGLAERAEQIRRTFNPSEGVQISPEVIKDIAPETVVEVSDAELKAIQEAMGAGNGAIEYVSDLPKNWEKSAAVSVDDVEGFKNALMQKRLANKESQKKIAKTGLFGATASVLGGVGAIAGGGAGSAMALGGGIAIIAGGGGFLIIGGLGYAGKKIFDKYKEKKAIDGFTTAHATKNKSPEKAGVIKDYLSKLW